MSWWGSHEVKHLFFLLCVFLSTINAKWNMNICVYHEHITEIVDNDCICAYIVLIVYANRFWNSAISVACIVWFKHIHITYHNMCLYIYILQPNWGSLRESIYWRFQGLSAGGLKYRWGHATRGRGAGEWF